MISFFPLKLFCLRVRQNFVGTINVSENFGCRKILRIKRGYHYSTLIFLPHRAKISAFRKILVSNIFMHRRGHHGFVETFLLHMTENFKCVPSVFQKLSRLEKCLRITDGGCIRLFRRNCSCLTVPKNFVA